MTVIGDAFVRVRPDLDGFQEETSRGVTGAIGGAAKAGAQAAAAIGTAAIAGGTAAVMAASDLGESMSKVQVVFGDTADQVLAWGASTEGTLLLSQQQALEAAGTFGNLFTSMGTGQVEAAAMSQEMVQLAQDLSSFNNLGVDETLEKLRAGLTGEAEPLKALGASFTAAELQAKAFSLGLVETVVDQDKVATAALALEQAQEKAAAAMAKHGEDSLEYRQAAQAAVNAENALAAAQAGSAGELTQAAKTQAAYALIMEKTTTAQGDAARTADGLANQLRILKADATDTMASVGQALIPVATEMVGLVGDAVKQVAPLVADLAGQIAPILTSVLGQVAPLLERLQGPLEQVFGAIGTVIEAVPWDVVTRSIGFLADGIGQLMGPLGDMLVPIIQAMGELLPPVAYALSGLAGIFTRLVTPALEVVGPLLVQLATTLSDVLGDAIDWLLPVLQDVSEQFGVVLADALEQLAPALLQLVDAFMPLIPVLAELLVELLPLWLELMEVLVPLLATVAEIVAVVLAGAVEVLVTWIADYLVPAFKTVVTWVTDKVVPVVTALGEAFDAVRQWISDNIDGIVGFVTGLPGRIAATVASLWDGLRTGISDAATWVGEQVDSIVGFVTGLPGRVLDALTDMAQAGLDLGAAFLDGLADGLKAVGGFAGDVAAGIVQVVKDAWNAVAGMVNDFVPNQIGWGAFSLDLPDDPIPTFHQGGVVPGMPGQEVPALLQAGETVRTRAQEAALQRRLSGSAAPAGGVTFTGPVSFGSDMGTAVAELEWSTRYRMAAAA